MALRDTSIQFLKKSGIDKRHTLGDINPSSLVEQLSLIT